MMLLHRTRAATARFLRAFDMSSSSSSPTSDQIDYQRTMQAILSACKDTNVSFKHEGGSSDGRITSAIKEKDYLDSLEAALKRTDPNTMFHRPPDRFWYDVRINGIPINLKLTLGGTDNVFNKKSIIFTLTGDENVMGNMNFSDWYKKILAGKIKPCRDRMTEYHFLVVNKETSEVLLKSILDIHTFKSNPCNDLQINWKNEFKNVSYLTLDDDYEQKVKSLLKTLQISAKQYLHSIIDFANANIDDDIHLSPLMPQDDHHAL